MYFFGGWAKIAKIRVKIGHSLGIFPKVAPQCANRCRTSEDVITRKVDNIY
ncbi:hypothetical protein [Shimazuella kribbensis]|uniref:hypothetical protein n=1 Tax=Shimazuella kribbensis TaxID=139808 RepID=UPI0012EC90F3|nr:hypothetical protein [Shimazuella kribbensis]